MPYKLYRHLNGLNSKHNLWSDLQNTNRLTKSGVNCQSSTGHGYRYSILSIVVVQANSQGLFINKPISIVWVCSFKNNILSINLDVQRHDFQVFNTVLENCDFKVRKFMIFNHG